MCPFNPTLSSNLPTLQSLPVGSQPNQIRDHFTQTWNSVDQYNLKRQLIGVNQAEVDFCVGGNTGGPLLYVPKELIDGLENFRSNDQILRWALEAAADPYAHVSPVSDDHMPQIPGVASGSKGVSFTFFKMGITFTATLSYKPEQFQHSAAGATVTQGRITGINIKGPEAEQTHTRQQQTGQKRDHAQDDQGPEAKAPKLSNSQNESSRFMAIRSSTSSTYISSASTSSGSSASTSSAPLPPLAPGASTPSAQALFDALKNSTPLPAIPTHQTAVAQVLGNQAATNDEIFKAIFPQVVLPSNAPRGELISASNKRGTNEKAFARFLAFLGRQQPSQPLAAVLQDLKTFSTWKRAYLQFNRTTAAKHFMERMRAGAFYLPSLDLIEKSDHHYGKSFLDASAFAGNVDEFFAQKDASVVALIAKKDKQGFKKLMDDIQKEKRSSHKSSEYTIMTNIYLEFFGSGSAEQSNA